MRHLLKSYDGPDAKKAPCSYYLKHRPKQAKGHSDENCFLLHPEKTPDWFKTDEKNLPMKAHNAKVPRPSPAPDNASTHEDQLAEFHSKIAFLQAQLSQDEDADV